MEINPNEQFVSALIIFLYGLGCTLVGRGVIQLHRKHSSIWGVIWVLLSFSGYCSLSLNVGAKCISSAILLFGLGGALVGAKLFPSFKRIGRGIAKFCGNAETKEDNRQNTKELIAKNFFAKRKK